MFLLTWNKVSVYNAIDKDTILLKKEFDLVKLLILDKINVDGKKYESENATIYMYNICR